ncbi:MFS transporter [bacterium]|nr:MFS transporter [bacterium]
MNRPQIAVAAGGFAAFVNIYALQALLPGLCQVFAAPRHQVSLTVTATTLAVALASPWAGKLSATWERRTLVAGSLLGLVLTTLLAASSKSLPELVVWRFAEGLFLPALVASLMAFVAENWKGAALSRTMCNYVTWTVIGGFVGRFVAGWAGAHLGWRAALGLTALLNALSGAVLLANLPRREASGPILGGHRLSYFLAQPAFQAAFACGFNVLFSLVAMFTYITFRLSEPPFALSADTLGCIFCVYLVGVVVTPLAGSLMARLGFRTSLLGASSVAIVGALFCLSTWLWLVIVGLTLSCCAAFIGQAGTSGYVGQQGGKERTSVLGLYLCFYYLGGSAGAALPGLLWPLGGWTACVGLIIALQLVTIGLVRFGFAKA